MGASGIEGLTTVRLSEAWFEQKFANDRVSVRGSALCRCRIYHHEVERCLHQRNFHVASRHRDQSTNGRAGDAACGACTRLRAKLTDNITGMVAVYDGDPARPGDGDLQERNRYGLNFRLRDPPLVVGQVEFDWSSALGKNTPGAFNLGGSRHFGDFDSVRFADDGRSLADPTPSGMPSTLRGDAGVFAVIEQKIASKGSDEDRGIGVFARGVASPPGRNLIDFYADAGFQANGWFDARPNDRFGLAVAYAHVSPAAQALDRDYRIFIDPSWSKCSYEGLLTAAHAYELRKGWIDQQNAQTSFGQAVAQPIR